MSDTWSFASMVMVASGVLSAIALQFLDAPYGKFAPDKKSLWGPLIPAKWGWMIQESPAIVVMLLYWIVWANPINRSATPNTILAAMFCFHYAVRSWIFPFLLNQSKPSPLTIVATAFLFCCTNGWLQGSYLFTSPHSLPSSYEKDWLGSVRVQFGIALFFLGWVGNQHADYVLRHLRDAKPGEEAARKKKTDDASPASRYKIPYGGLFKFTSAANYTGEIIEWTGFAIAANNPAAYAFLAFTLANLVPRGVSYHRWYKQTFPNYPVDRKAVIPFVL